MNVYTCSSSNIAAIAWDNGTLFIQFNKGGVYSYEGVSQDTFDQMRSAESVGKFFHAEIKPSYVAVKLQHATLTEGVSA